MAKFSEKISGMDVRIALDCGFHYSSEPAGEFSKQNVRLLSQHRLLP
jgi:hypothetical protein